MIFPINIIGTPVLRNKTADIDKDYKDLPKLIKNLFETMYASEGVGLAAAQIGKSINLFVIDASPMADEDPDCEGFKKVFINARIIEKKRRRCNYE